MDSDAKKTALRMIPYGLYVLTAEADDGRVGAATVNWVTQASFAPPLLVVGVKADSAIHGIIKDVRRFGLSVLGKDQGGVAYDFFKPVEREGDKIGGHAFQAGTTGTPILESAPAAVECSVVEFIEKGDHSVVVGEVVDARVTGDIEGRPDEGTLWLRDLGEKIFYGG
ncbi:MAG: flavin reductase family protein [Gemmatimonadales bacterium]